MSTDHYHVDIFEQSRAMCCLGCKHAAQMIVDSGLERFYQYRQQVSDTPDMLAPEQLDEMEAYDNQLLAAQITETEGTLQRLNLVVEGVHCAACAWVIEKTLQKNPAVAEVSVNTTTRKASIVWDPAQGVLSDLLKSIYRLGYKAHPYRPQLAEQLDKEQQRYYIRRLAVAGIGMMQVMMLAVGLYVGGAFWIDGSDRIFLRSVSLLFAFAVISYAAQPFFLGALRNLHSRQLGMDIPVSLALLLAFSSSVWATLTDSGEVYFDSVTMFTFFLLTGRYLEQLARSKAASGLQNWQRLLPLTVHRCTAEGVQLVSLNDIHVGDMLRIKPGETIPVDGTVCHGSTTVNEAILTGEAIPCQKSAQSSVSAGSINVEGVIDIVAEKIGEDTLIGQMHRLIETAQQHKPAIQRFVDRLAARFVFAILSLALSSYVIWLWLVPEQAFWIALAVLVVSCPCALALATPVVLTCLTGFLARHGLVLTRNHAVEMAHRLSHVCFDKTGTLTSGVFSIQQIECRSNAWTQAQILNHVAALEQCSAHPIASAFQPYLDSSVTASNIAISPGHGVAGDICGVRWSIGRAAVPRQGGVWLDVMCEQDCVAHILVADQLRADAKALIRDLQAQNIQCVILSGDASDAVSLVAAELGIQQYHRGYTAAQKMQFIQQLQSEGHVVMMVGDGLNDAPVLQAADFSVAMGSAMDMTQTSADCVLVHEQLSVLLLFIEKMRQTRRIIRQNIMWALGYNLSAVPIAMLGLIPPYLAALGMSASSLLVVLNALRINRIQRSKVGV